MMTMSPVYSVSATDLPVGGPEEWVTSIKARSKGVAQDSVQRSPGANR